MPRHTNLLDPRRAALVVVDVQEKLALRMIKRRQVEDNIIKLIKSAQSLGVPVLLTEQYPKGLGATLSSIRQLIPELPVIEKLTFSCCGAPRFIETVHEYGAEQLLLVGMETHVCIFQTAMDLLTLDTQVYVAVDAVCARFKQDHLMALRRLEHHGVTLVTTEAVIFELLQTAAHEHFKKLMTLIK